MRELEAQAKFLAPVIAAAVRNAVEPLQKLLQAKDDELAALSKRIDELPVPVEPDLAAIAALVVVPEPTPGKDAEPVDLDALAKAAAELIEIPEPIPGKDAEPVDLEALAKAAAELVVVATAPEVDLEALAKAAAELVVVPEPIPGKDAEPVDLDALAKAAAGLVVVPTVETVDLQEVAKAVAEFVELPKVDLALLAAEAAKLVVTPEPIPGKDAEPIDVEELARSAAALVPVPVMPQPEHGRDALDLEILPSIDESKQYPRGTYAAHRGGLWKSFERTNGLRGWECIVDGVDGVTVTQDSVREFSVTLSKSSGAESVLKATLPAMIYKGVWRPCAAEPGDTFTFGGSMWHCDKATDTKPGESDAWTLATKRGRDGNDAVVIKRDPPEVVKL